MTNRLIHKRRQQLQTAVTDLGAAVVAALKQSLTALRQQDLVLAEQLIAGDAQINSQRRVLEQECLVTLAAYKPAGADLRAVAACMELASELERLGDYAADVARILIRQGASAFPSEPAAAVAALADAAIALLEETLAAFARGAAEDELRQLAAREVQIDHDEHAITAAILGQMREDAGFATSGTYLLWIAHNFERVADRAINVAERAIYVVSGITPELD